MSMGTTIIIIGIINILLGVFIKSSPSIISSYSSLSDKEKANVDIAGLATVYRNYFVAMGVLPICGYYLFIWIGWIDIAQSMTMLILPCVLAMLIHGRKYDRNTKKWKTDLGIGVIATVCLLVWTFVPYSYVPSKVEVNKDGVSFSGIYQTTIKLDDIVDVELLDSIPPIIMKISGFGMHSVKKGNFKLKGYGKCKLLINGYAKPFLVIETKNGVRTIFCNNDKSKAETAYKQITEILNLQ